MNFAAFRNLKLRGGFVLARVETSGEPFADAIDRPALAKTSIIGNRFDIVVADGMSDQEVSVTLYHEVLEAATVAAALPPESVIDLNEHGFETIAYRMHGELGAVSPTSLNRMLEMFGFQG